MQVQCATREDEVTATVSHGRNGADGSTPALPRVFEIGDPQ
jgi:hypothetical protein